MRRATRKFRKYKSQKKSPATRKFLYTRGGSTLGSQEGQQLRENQLPVSASPIKRRLVTKKESFEFKKQPGSSFAQEEAADSAR
ncbi:hypothetical protein J6590_088973 [Homalodisca vitripennis]|nr:hypothetical protein J6590_088973 [Homalodisca vitripennis]